MTHLAPLRTVLLLALAALAAGCGAPDREAARPTVDLDTVAPTRPSVSQPLPDPPAAYTRYPLRWTHHVAPEGRAALEEAMSRPPRGLAAGDALVLRAPESRAHARETVRVTTCAQYQSARSRGFSSDGPPSAEIAFVTGCTALRFMREARPSRKSYLANLRLDRDALDQLPETMSLDFWETALPEGKTLRAYNPRLQVTRADATSVVYGVAEAEWTVDVLAFGDFDHDGIEDVLLRQTLGRRNARPLVYTHVVLTRKSAGALLVCLPVSLGELMVEEPRPKP